jgi:hypothetical protein
MTLFAEGAVLLDTNEVSLRMLPLDTARCLRFGVALPSGKSEFRRGHVCDRDTNPDIERRCRCTVTHWVTCQRTGSVARAAYLFAV